MGRSSTFLWFPLLIITIWILLVQENFALTEEQVSRISVIVIVFVFVFVFVFVIVFFFGRVMSPHHSDQMSQRSQVSGIAN